MSDEETFWKFLKAFGVFMLILLAIGWRHAEVRAERLKQEPPYKGCTITFYDGRTRPCT